MLGWTRLAETFHGASHVSPFWSRVQWMTSHVPVLAGRVWHITARCRGPRFSILVIRSVDDGPRSHAGWTRLADNVRCRGPRFSILVTRSLDTFGRDVPWSEPRFSMLVVCSVDDGPRSHAGWTRLADNVLCRGPRFSILVTRSLDTFGRDVPWSEPRFSMLVVCSVDDGPRSHAGWTRLADNVLCRGPRFSILVMRSVETSHVTVLGGHVWQITCDGAERFSILRIYFGGWRSVDAGTFLFGEYVWWRRATFLLFC